MNKYSGSLFHLSTDNLDGKVLKPRIPSNYLINNGFEDGTIKRVCFSTSIDGCLSGMSSNIKDKEFYVHVPDEKVKVKVPSKEQVPDVNITHERWILSDVKVKCIGKIKVFDAIDPGFTYTYGKNNKATLYKWKYEWMDKYMKESEEYITEKKSKGDYRLQKFMKNYKYISNKDFDANKPGIIKAGEVGSIELNGHDTPVLFYDSKFSHEKPIKTASAATTKSGQKLIRIDKKFVKNTKAKDLKYILDHEQGHLLKNKKTNPDRNDPEYDKFDKKVEPLLANKTNKHTSIDEFEADKYSLDRPGASTKDFNKAMRHAKKYIIKNYNKPILKKPGTKEEIKENIKRYHDRNAGMDNDINLRSKAAKYNNDNK